MIYLQADGRLGNHMFHYAFARTLMIKYPHLGGISIFYPYENKKDKKDLQWGGDQLSGFNVIEYNIVDKPYIDFWQYFLCMSFRCYRRLVTKINAKMYLEISLRFQHFLNKNGVYAMTSEAFLPLEDSKFDNAWVVGNYENPSYFDEIKDVLIREFKPKYDLLNYNKNLYRIIKTSNSVCISIRKGDYLAPGNEKFNICSDLYFEKAIEKIKSLIGDIQLIVFSDDITYVKKNMKFNEPVLYENNNGNDPTWEKLRLMSACNHFIISNSTFSWWAQYLCQNENKIVIAPRPWRQNSYCDYLYDSHFITLNPENGEECSVNEEKRYEI